MTATDELRRMLDERGVEWGDVLSNGARSSNLTEWRLENGGTAIATEWVPGKLTVGTTIEGLTPAQAVEATLGRGTCKDKGNIERFICSECGCRLDLQDEDWEPTMWRDGEAMVPSFCPHCGMRCVG